MMKRISLSSRSKLAGMIKTAGSKEFLPNFHECIVCHRLGAVSLPVTQHNETSGKSIRHLKISRQ
jgi:hypothetical protein